MADARTALRPRTALLAAALLVLHAALAVGAMWEASPTFDEVSHLPAGLAIVATGEVRLNREHPPLVKELAGLAASTQRPRLPLDGEAYARADQWSFGREVTYGGGNDTRAVLRAGRLPVVALSLLAATVCFAWARQRFGDAAGLTALALYAFSPLALAHGALVTTDAAAALGVVATMWLWWRATRGESDTDASSAARAARGRLAHWLPYALCGLALGAALAAKFSAALLLPMMLVCDLLANGARDLRRRLLGWLVVAGAALVVLDLAYLSLAAPLQYVEDARLLYANRLPGYRAYLAGDFAPRFPHYFVVAMAVKSTPVELLAIAGALALAGARRRQRWRDDVYLWLPALGWIAAMSALAAGVGVRYVLPAYPLLFVLAGALAPELVRARRLARFAPQLLAAILLAHALEAVVAFPGYLSYFNRFAGGSAAGVRWLDDSNLDWGQSFYRLPQWLAARGLRHARVLPMPNVTAVQAHGVTLEPMLDSDWARPRPGAYAVSAHLLVRGLAGAERGAPTDWLRRYRPADTFDGSMYLFVFR